VKVESDDADPMTFRPSFSSFFRSARPSHLPSFNFQPAFLPWLPANAHKPTTTPTIQIILCLP
jgi:hypothetical protein